MGILILLCGKSVKLSRAVSFFKRNQWFLLPLRKLNTEEKSKLLISVKQHSSDSQGRSILSVHADRWEYTLDRSPVHQRTLAMLAMKLLRQNFKIQKKQRCSSIGQIKTRSKEHFMFNNQRARRSDVRQYTVLQLCS